MVKLSSKVVGSGIRHWDLVLFVFGVGEMGRIFVGWMVSDGEVQLHGYICGFSVSFNR